MFTLNPVKGESTSATLDIAQIMASTVVTDAYFKEYANLSSVVVALKSTEGHQSINIMFHVISGYDGTQALSATTFIDSTAHDSFVFEQMLLVDHTGSTFSINVDELTAALPSVVSDFSVTLQQGTGGGAGSGISNPPAISPGTYSIVTVDSNGRVIAGSNPTTLASYGISDAVTQGQLDSLQASLSSQISNIVSNTDPAALDSLSEVVSAFEAADGSLQGAITSLATSATSAVAAEASRAQAAEASLASSIAGLSSLIGGGMFEAVVGSSEQVSSGHANYTSLQSAINAISAGQSIYVMAGIYAENITVNKSCNILGKGNSSVINGAVAFNSSADYCSFGKIRVTGNLTLSAGADHNSLHDVWFAASSVITDDGASNNINGIQD